MRRAVPTSATPSRLQRRLLLLTATTAGAAALPLAGCERGDRPTTPAATPATTQRPARAPDPFDSDSSPRR